MKSWAIWTAGTALAAIGFAVAGGGPAAAAPASTPSGTHAGNVSVLGGNQVDVPVNILIGICGTAAAVLGFAAVACEGGASAAVGSAGLKAANVTMLRGNVVRAPFSIAPDTCGNSVGIAVAKCHGGVHLPVWSGLAQGGRSAGHGVRAGNTSVGSGDDVEIPISVCGNPVAVLGDSSAGCVGGATVGSADAQRAVADPAELGALPGIANLPVLNGLADGGALLPASKLSAYQTGQGGSGESSGSFAALAIGALLAAAAVLKLAGGRSRTRSAKANGVAA